MKNVVVPDARTGTSSKNAQIVVSVPHITDPLYLAIRWEQLYESPAVKVQGPAGNPLFIEDISMGDRDFKLFRWTPTTAGPHTISVNAFGTLTYLDLF